MTASHQSATETRIHPHLTERVEGAVAILRVERESHLGALNAEMIQRLGDYTEALAARQDVRVLIVTGTGRGFVTGADIGGYHGASQAEFDAFQDSSRRAFDAIAGLPQPTICAVNGYALGGGLELALCCDFILVAAWAKLGVPEVKLGLIPGGGGTQRLTRRIGVTRAKHLVLTGRTIEASEALAIGLALETCEGEALMPRALELARELCQQAPLALARGKRVIDEGMDLSLADALTIERRAVAGLFATRDGKEGIEAFIAKRPPRFIGA